MSLGKAWPYGGRASASLANLVGSLSAIAFVEDGYKNPFYYLAAYAGAVYFTSNAYELSRALRPSTTPNDCELEKGLMDVRTIQK